MAKQKKSNPEVTFLRKMMAMKAAGIKTPPATTRITEAADPLQPLDERMRQVLGIVKLERKSTEMVYFIMYDIEDNKIRRYVSKFLEKKGFLRVQRSVFLARSERHDYDTICQTLKEVNAIYESDDSIILIPISNDELRSLSLIGKNVDVKAYHDRPNAMIF